MGIVLIGLELGRGGELFVGFEEVVWVGRYCDDVLLLVSVCSGGTFDTIMPAWVVVVMGGGL